MQQFKTIFKHQSQLAKLADQIEKNAAIQKIWDSVIPEMLTHHTWVSSVKHKRLTIYADNGAIAAKTKMLLPSLLNKLQKQELEVTSIRVIVQVQNHPQIKQKPSRKISLEVSENLKTTAKNIANEKLAESLLRLSSRTS